MSNVINFPACLRKKSRLWYGGRWFRTEEAVLDYMSERDWRRYSQWQSRHLHRLDYQEQRQA